MSTSRGIGKILDEIIEELILLDPENVDELTHLRVLVNELEEDIPDDEHKQLIEYIKHLSKNSPPPMNIKDSITAFQESVESLFDRYSEDGESIKVESAFENADGNQDDFKPEYLNEPELLQDFLVESEDHLQSAEKYLILLEEEPDNRQHIDSIFRLFHTIKGIAGFLGIKDIQNLAHEYENYLDSTRSGKVFITGTAIDLILQAIDGTREILSALETSLVEGCEVKHDVDIKLLIHKIQNIDNEDNSENAKKPPEEFINQSESEDADISEVKQDSDSPDKTDVSDEAINLDFSGDSAITEEENLQQKPEEKSTDKGVEISLEDVQTALTEPDELEALEDPELLMDFLAESEEYIQGVEEDLIKWESEPDNLELVDDIFRPFHTIKGVAGFLNLIQIQTLSHEFENLLDKTRSGKIKLTKQVTDLILAGIDAYRKIFQTLRESMESGSYQKHGIDIEPFIYKLRLLQSNSPADISEKQEKNVQGSGDGDVVTRSAVSSLEEGAEQTPQKEEPANQEEQKTEKKLKNQNRNHGYKKTASSVIKVDTDKMDHLIDMVGELVITQNMVSQNKLVRESSNKRLLGDIAQLRRITSTLQNISMSLRMVPIESTFLKMKRIVRDLAYKSEKKIHLQLLGKQTEIDRNMVEKIYDPLVHMIRNSCDHGIESPEERTEAGKNETGTIRLNAYHKGGNIVIEINDDGAGLDKNHILAKAIERGLIKEDTDLSERQIYDLLFHPGFSTAKKVTEISGRGVGMDVVRRTIEKMRGQVEIESEEGQGTTFYIKLPLTLAIIDGVIVKVGAERYVIPTLSIEESVQPSEPNYNFVAGQGETIMVRDHIFPLIRIHDLFDVKGAVEKPWDGIVMLVDVGSGKAGLLVDELVDKQEVVIKSMGEQFQSLPGISGGAILGDGSVGLILDVPNLMQVRDAKQSEKKGKILSEYNAGLSDNALTGRA